VTLQSITETRLHAEGLTLAYGGRRGSRGGHAGPVVHGDRRAERGWQDHVAACARQDAEAPPGFGVPGRPGDQLVPGEGGRPAPRAAPTELDRPRDGITVADLVARGRYPHQRLLRQWSKENSTVVAESLRSTGVDALAERLVDELSGGQRQTDLLLLDEPTTYLDIAHQIDILDLCAELPAKQGRTLVAVLHDLNHAARYASHMIAMRDGRIIATGPPEEVVTTENVEEIFELPCRVMPCPETGTPLVIPKARRSK
jgi:iron complex transport system ATP-binding protein